jgi:hypothetical protein
LAAIRSRGENIPGVPGFAEARAEMREKMLAARPLYELLEPASGCDARHLAWLERIAGDDFLATLLAKGDEADLVRRIAWRDGGPLTVAVRGETDVVSVNDLAPWLGALVSFEESDPEAVALLARHLAAKAGPSDGEFLDRKTWLFRGRAGLLPSLKPRLIGAKARKAEQGTAGARGGGASRRGGARTKGGGKTKRRLRGVTGRATETVGRHG